jgi:protein-S-isoprenylcysteine O-methyltransferase Ste14
VFILYAVILFAFGISVNCNVKFPVPAEFIMYANCDITSTGLWVSSISERSMPDRWTPVTSGSANVNLAFERLVSSTKRCIVEFILPAFEVSIA